ncbi:class I SAM-dependent methyltransferase [Roseomonas hellenica]|uniref:Class I SAM-dependent methyltransferase n=2 Tax=Plastoroseomonas hellenica TaxID=2687306 RepID=A0ABS5F3T2_9PROT|nr:class I SAM-dependent methyltransferase [Plastoroseomonas hellenica]MBR0667186.1 class I SAM-dependent methyltransferase [Plastoroseomonas hellenica]
MSVGFESVRLASEAAFRAMAAPLAETFLVRQQRQLDLAQSGHAIHYWGFCAFCGDRARFTCDWHAAFSHPDGRQEPNWRERLVCDRCGLNNRLRAALHFMQARAGLQRSSLIYLTEQATPFYAAMRQRSDCLVGSEFLRDGTPPGGHNVGGLRHEDVTALSFSDGIFDLVGCFEVLEHVHDYRAGLRELRRVLRPGGHLTASFPFRMDLSETLVRARIDAAGEVEHLAEPEYHGDPLREGGILCFRHFGWDILDAMRMAGFSEAACHLYWSWDLGYLGDPQCLFHAVR